MSNIQAKLDYVDALAQCFLETGRDRSVDGDLEEGLKYTFLAATILSKQNRTLSSPLLEANLTYVAQHLMEGADIVSLPHHEVGSKATALHVLSEALPAGGVTAMAIRWMRNDPGRIHSVALLSTDIPIPEGLAAAALDSGGAIYTADPTGTFVQRARWLRTLARTVASFVVLHVDVSDVICGAAFGVDGGPPVLLVNHTAHTFWAGATIADLVLNVRGSELEKHWTTTYRGICRSATLPIPLLRGDTGTADGTARTDGKRRAKEHIGIPPDAVMMLTVGASFKYLPTEALDFVETYERLLADLPNVYLVVAGFRGDSRWARASAETGSRIRLLGTLSQSDLAIAHEAADIYVEAFPFGTTTALLEAGLKGIPAILAPGMCPPPYASDGVALDGLLQRSDTIDEYKHCVRQLCLAPNDRLREGERLRHSIRNHHTGNGWNQYLRDAMGRIPQEHSVQPSIHPIWTPQFVHEYWSAFSPQSATGYGEDLEHAIARALLLGLHPRLTPEVLRAHKSSRLRSVHRAMPSGLLGYLCNSLLPHLSPALGSKVFRLIAFVYRGSICSRLIEKGARLFGMQSVPAPYSEYRHLSERGSLATAAHSVTAAPNPTKNRFVR